MASVKCELWLCVDNVGDYAVGKDEIQALSDCDGFRMVKVTVNVPAAGTATLASVA